MSWGVGGLEAVPIIVAHLEVIKPYHLHIECVVFCHCTVQMIQMLGRKSTYRYTFTHLVPKAFGLLYVILVSYLESFYLSTGQQKSPE